MVTNVREFRVSARLLLALVALPAVPSSSIAQATGTLSGVVRDSTGIAVYGAQISVAMRTATTDSRGEFLLSGIPEGNVTVGARRLGFVPGSVDVVIATQGVARVTIKLSPIPTTLQPVIVQSGARAYTGRLAGYYQRLERRSSGYFISRDQIDRENPRMLSQLLTHVPGVTASRMRGGGGGVRMRGRNCWPLVWLDGIPMGAGEVDLDAFVPSSLHGIELYLGSTTAPLKYIASRDRSSCGTILLWSRGPDTDPILPRIAPNYNLDRLIASLAVYTAEQVDRKAELGSHSLNVVYPPALLADGVRGSVVAEFVVDTAGRIEQGSFGIISSTHPLFAESVRSALEGLSYQPAMKNGARVRQVVQQPFAFKAGSGRAPRGRD